jgi:hypothetical protein
MQTFPARKSVYTVFPVILIALGLACGYSTPAKTMPVAGTTPTISQLAPENMNAGSAGFTLTVNGTNFGSKAVVNWNGTAQTANTTFVSASQVTVSIPASLIATSGTAMVTVTNPGNPGTGIYGTGATLAETSTPATFTIN